MRPTYFFRCSVFFVWVGAISPAPMKMEMKVFSMLVFGVGLMRLVILFSMLVFWGRGKKK